MEKMTDKELEQLKKLQAKQKRIQREQEAFKKQVFENKEQVLKWLEADTVLETYYENVLAEISAKYEMNVRTFIEIMNNEEVARQLTNWLNGFRQN